jgi:hypothetical protein
MANQRRAAISADELADTPLSKLSADRFLELLSDASISHLGPIVSDKKKYELWIEEDLGGIKVGDFIGKLRVEKKKLELEKQRVFEDLVLKRVVEDPPDPRRQIVDPVIFERIAQRLDAIEQQLARR